MTSKAHALACAAALLAACGAPGTRQTHEGGALAPVPTASPAGAAAYRIDSARSELRVLVYRAGPMARLGHNHVIVNRALSGWVDAAGTAAAQALSLQVPVAEFIVDDPQAREAEGTDFSQDVTDDARAGTRRNMLSAALLDADRFPAITLRSVAVTPAAQVPGADGHARTWVATLAVQVAGHASKLTVPFTLESAADSMSASGTVVLRQSDLGLIPISVMLGALQVQDELTVEFKLVATKS
ncbi:MAG: YceI family protein [Steroidobacteraceae bacterium]|jgi:polyisoprenoid-binding protein YceI